jgi:hypothetical protein
VPLLFPLILAATPVPLGGLVPFTPPAQAPLDSQQAGFSSVELFDPVARAQQLADQLPRSWSGSYQAFGGGARVPVQLRLASLRPMGQMVDIRGELTMGGVSTPVQGNLNAKSDQLELLPLIDNLSLGLEPGGDFLGLQGFSLSGWNAPRLTNPGGRLVLEPEAAPAERSAPTIRGLW